MLNSREQLIRKVAEKSGYWQKNVRDVFNCLNDVIPEYFSEVTDEEDVVIQLMQGIKLSVHVVPSRDRVDPRDRTPIVCKETVKPACKFSNEFRRTIQNNYDEKKDG